MKPLLLGLVALLCLNGFQCESSSEDDAAPPDSVEPGTKWTLVSKGRAGLMRFGLASHVGQGYGAPLQNAADLESMNCRAWRDDIPWNTAENPAGTRLFKPAGGAAPFHDTFAALASHASRNYDITYMPVMAYGGPYATDFASTPWRAHFVDYCVASVREYLNAGYAAKRLVLTIWNEPNETIFGDYGIDFNDGAGVQNYGLLCKEVRAAVRAVNPEVRIMGGEGANGAHGLYAAWNASFQGTPNFWKDGLDIYSTHEYHEVFPTHGTPEGLWNRMQPYFQGILEKATAAGRSDFSVAISEGGWNVTDPGGTTDEIYYSRYPFLLSATPGLEFVTFYAMRDNAQGYHFVSEGTWARRPKCDVVRDAFKHLHVATTRRYYRTQTEHAVKMKLANGHERLAIWSLGGGMTQPVQIQAGGAGTLSVETMGGATSTQALSAGFNTVQVALTDTARVLHADVKITFPEFP